MSVVSRLLRGEPLDLVARDTNVSVGKLTEWRERALEGAASALKERERDDRDDEIARLKSKVGEITMDNELLYAKIAAMEGKRPLARRRPRQYPVIAGGAKGVRGKNQQAGVTRALTQARQPRPRRRSTGTGGNQTPRLMENLMRISHGGETLNFVFLGYT